MRASVVGGVASAALGLCLVAPTVAAAEPASVNPRPAVARLSTAVEPVLRQAAVTLIDDRALIRSAGGWASQADGAAYARTVTRSLKVGASLVTRVATVNGGSVQLRFGPGRGVVDIWVGAVRRASLSTAAATVQTRNVSVVGVGKLTLRVRTQGRGVFVDAVRLNPPAPASAPGALVQMDRNSAGVGGNGAGVERAALSPGGKLVAFWSNATNLFAGVTDGDYHLFVSQVSTGKVIGVADTNSALTTTAHPTQSEEQGDSGRMVVGWAPIQPGDTDSRYLLFTTRATNLFAPGTVPSYAGPYLFIKNFVTDLLTPVPLAEVDEAAWSPDSKKIAISTTARYGSDTNDDADIWSYDLTAPSNANLFRVSANASGQLPPRPISGVTTSNHFSWAKDSDRILFESAASTLVPGDTNGVEDVFIKRVSTGAITRVSTSANGAQGNNRSGKPSWSPDNTRIAFDSKATNLAAGGGSVNYDVFVKTLASGAISLTSRNSQGGATLFDNRAPRWAPTGTRLAFDSDNDTMAVKADSNGYEDVYVTDLITGKHQLASVTPTGHSGNFRSSQWNIFGANPVGWTPNGHGLLFLSTSSNFSSTDTNGFASSLFLKTV